LSPKWFWLFSSSSPCSALPTSKRRSASPAYQLESYSFWSIWSEFQWLILQLTRRGASDPRCLSEDGRLASYGYSYLHRWSERRSLLPCMEWFALSR